MPRNNQGLYELPLPPVIPGTPIEAAWANTTNDDIAVALTGSLPRDGSAPMVGPLLLASNTPNQAKEAVSKAYVDSFLAFATGVPVGIVMSFAGSTVPSAAWLKCDGRAVSRTTYSTLFSVIGTIYGAGNGSTTFNLPDMRDYFARGRADSRPVGSKQDDGYKSHTHALNDPGHSHTFSGTPHTHNVNDAGHAHNLSVSAHSHTATQAAHTHSASQTAHTHTLTTATHSHTINDPGHDHATVVGQHGISGTVGAGLAAPGWGTQGTITTNSDATGVTVNQAAALTGNTDSKQPTVTIGNAQPSITVGSTTVTGTATSTTTGVSIQNATATGTVGTRTTGIAVGASGTTETRPKNIAYDFYIKAMNDTTQVGAITGITSSDSDMIEIDNASPAVPELLIKSNVPFGMLKLDANNLVPLANLPYENTSFLGFFDPSAGDNPSEAFPAADFGTGDEFILSDSGTITLFNPLTLTSSLVNVSPGWMITYVENSLSNPTGWYYQIPSGTIAAINVAFVPAGGVTSSNVQDAIAELGNTKLDSTGGTLTGELTVESNVVIETTDSANAALRVTQLGSGPALLVEDSVHPDSTPFTVLGDGKVIVGMASAQAAGLNYPLQAASTGSVGLGLGRYSADTNGPLLAMGKSRSGSVGALGQNAQSGDTLGAWSAYGDGGSTWVQGAGIWAVAEGPFTATSAPGAWSIRTTPSGSITPVERIRVRSTGEVMMGTDVPGNGPTLSIGPEYNGYYGLTSVPRLKVNSTSSGATIAIGRWSADATGPYFAGYKSRSTTVGGDAAVIQGDILCQVTAAGNDGVAASGSRAWLTFRANQNWAAGAHGTYAQLITTPDGSIVPQTVMEWGADRVSRALGGLQISRVSISATASVDGDGNVWSGSYTPTVTNVTNASVNSPGPCTVTRVGNSVSVAGHINITPTAAGTCQVRLSLPVPFNLTAENQLAGNGASDGSLSCRIKGDATNDGALLTFNAPSTTSQSFGYNFTYRLF